MKFIRFMARDRFNMVDASAMCLTSVSFISGSFWLGASFFVGGVLLSALVTIISREGEEA